MLSQLQNTIKRHLNVSNLFLQIAMSFLRSTEEISRLSTQHSLALVGWLLQLEIIVSTIATFAMHYSRFISLTSISLLNHPILQSLLLVHFVIDLKNKKNLKDNVSVKSVI